MKHYSPEMAQTDLMELLAAVHQLKETIVITPTDANDVHAAVLIPKSEWEALRELAFLQQSPLPTPPKRPVIETEWG
ncbi:type II toxin-antitoxin system Phd/YefM family antitoxin [Levilactobacillus fujinensis]|uniref:Type II toxin-antitoxin system Phd/YefM family antitoxin n=1 Tax=Levilactobacillus fujinensis TaxID=2486024 RepID=A0ABW1TGH9_9LACO|nr:type II toxin-antitoxin system Phd/YefM family antitoxin [Levilactobacillus fujinensis]